MATERDLDLKRIADELAKVGVTKQFFDGLPQELREMAFYVSELNKLSTINSLLRSLQGAVEDGESFTTWKNGITREAVENLSNARLQTIYRTNLQNAFNRGARQRARERSDTFPFLVYDAVDDASTRPSHAALDGVIRAVDDPFWDTHVPPLGFNCRCTIRSLTKNQAGRAREAQGKSGNQSTTRELASIRKSGGRPDKGFNTRTTKLNTRSRKLLEDQISKLPRRLRKPFRDKLRLAETRVNRWYIANSDAFSDKI